MLLSLVTAAALAFAPAPAAGATTCAPARIGEVASISAPAVIVLGERKGTQPDLLRAERVVHRLAKQGPVTLALEAVHREVQPVLDQYAAGRAQPGDLPALLRWSEHWGFPWRPYERLVTSAVVGVDVLAAGLDRGGRPPQGQVVVPPSYIHVLADAMGEHPVPVELEGAFVEAVAWRDHAIARHAVENWSGEGWLVIVADRLHVEGGKGIGWQAQRLTQAPVHTFLLAGGGPCYPGDRVLR